MNPARQYIELVGMQLRAMRQEFVMIAVVMSVVFRSIRAGFYTMLPNVWPVAVVFGLVCQKNENQTVVRIPFTLMRQRAWRPQNRHRAWSRPAAEEPLCETATLILNGDDACARAFFNLFLPSRSCTAPSLSPSRTLPRRRSPALAGLQTTVG